MALYQKRRDYVIRSDVKLISYLINTRINQQLFWELINCLNVFFFLGKSTNNSMAQTFKMWIFAGFEYATFLEGLTQSKTFADIDRFNKPKMKNFNNERKYLHRH